MSAFFVGADHIDAILSWIDTCYRYSVPTPSGMGVAHARVEKPTPQQWTEIGKALLAENVKSLRHRYPGDFAEMIDLDVNRYRYRHNAHFVTMTPNLAAAVLKLVDCYEYQSCEHDGWGESWSLKFCDFVRSAAAGQVPGYEAAAWTYTRPADADNVKRLSDLFAS